MPEAESSSTSSPDETFEVARALTNVLHSGDLLVLTGELGVGKTVFAKGIGAGLGVIANIVSPTFTLAREYKTANSGVDFLHIDAYRMNSSALDLPSELETLGIETELERAITLIEWGSGVPELLDVKNAIYVDISLDYAADLDENVKNTDNIGRIINVTGLGERG
ncbi:MAG: tRNA (adenosine(37)-N6)-threonylcarbamoyltransferase complex ATPase subunit type 1 TsaE [Bifidobacteriaceae bacterium]|jgi:tRNA threonylcarbamoyladenosine biosynthesis protein TsaE|nr:tRNA (adenosine(37)-N6)-threonylcarbamoyltransferase complex ATPase subunit type 1 TsaE [Bifidobacteriaceae bacterium]